MQTQIQTITIIQTTRTYITQLVRIKVLQKCYFLPFLSTFKQITCTNITQICLIKTSLTLTRLVVLTRTSTLSLITTVYYFKRCLALARILPVYNRLQLKRLSTAANLLSCLNIKTLKRSRILKLFSNSSKQALAQQL